MDPSGLVVPQPRPHQGPPDPGHALAGEHRRAPGSARRRPSSRSARAPVPCSSSCPAVSSPWPTARLRPVPGRTHPFRTPPASPSAVETPPSGSASPHRRTQTPLLIHGAPCLVPVRWIRRPPSRVALHQARAPRRRLFSPVSLPLLFPLWFPLPLLIPLLVSFGQGTSLDERQGRQEDPDAAGLPLLHLPRLRSPSPASADAGEAPQVAVSLLPSSFPPAFSRCMSLISVSLQWSGEPRRQNAREPPPAVAQIRRRAVPESRSRPPAPSSSASASSRRRTTLPRAHACARARTASPLTASLFAWSQRQIAPSPAAPGSSWPASDLPNRPRLGLRPLHFGPRLQGPG